MPICAAGRLFCQSPNSGDIFDFCKVCGKAIHERCYATRTDSKNSTICWLCHTVGREEERTNSQKEMSSAEQKKNNSSSDLSAEAGGVEEDNEAGEDNGKNMPRRNDEDESDTKELDNEDEDDPLPAMDDFYDDEEETKMPPANEEDDEDDEDPQNRPSSSARAHRKSTPPTRNEGVERNSPERNTNLRQKAQANAAVTRSAAAANRRASRSQATKSDRATTTAKKKVGRPTKRKEITNTNNSPSTAASSNKRQRKSSQQKAFLLTSDRKKPDPLVMKRVAFDANDGGYGAQVVDHFGGKEIIRKSLSKGRYLLGTIMGLNKKKKRTETCYDVAWEDSQLKTTTVELSCLIPALELSRELKSKGKEKSALERGSPGDSSRGPTTPSTNVSKLFGRNMLNILLQVDEGEEGEPLDSDDDTEASSKDDLNDDESTSSSKNEDNNFRLEETRKYFLPWFTEDNNSTTDSRNTAGENEGFRWTSEGSLKPPATISQRGKSRVKPDRRGCFENPLSSFFSFVPLKMFRGICMYSNAYAHAVMRRTGKQEISGARWASDITLTEMMKFFGLLFHMVLRPTPGTSYPHCWTDPGWHPYTAHMALRRFQQIRSVLHFNYGMDESSNVNDALYKVRPLLNCIKLTFPRYLEFGDNFALDEASVASRSRYGNDVIFFNPTKPGGKYHFRFYLLCCSSSYACIRLRMHTKNNSDFGDGYFETPTESAPATSSATLPSRSASLAATSATRIDGGCQSDKETSSDESAVLASKKPAALVSTTVPTIPKKTVSLVLDICKPLYDTGATVNMDNYYTSPEVAVALQKKGVFMRGTCRANRVGFPAAVKFSNTEANNQGRGAIKKMVDHHNQLAAYGWVDGNPVHFLTSADGTATSTVNRRIGRQVQKVRAPIAIRRYNHNMHAVDRHDQLRETYSLSKRHGFKKYYHKIAMGLMDMVVVNAWIHFRLVHKEECKKPSARYNFMTNLADGFLKTDWASYNSTESAKVNEKIFRSMFQNGADADANNLEDGGFIDDETALSNVDYCHPVSVSVFLQLRMSKKKGLSCQVCKFEGRGSQKLRNVVICLHHRLRLCTLTHKAEDDSDENAAVVQRRRTGGDRTRMDYSWRAPDGSCWRKAHSYYIPNGLFANNVTPMTEAEVREGMTSGKQLKFQCVWTGSELYKKKHLALGTKPRNMLGRRKKKQRMDVARKKKASTSNTNNEEHQQDDDNSIATHDDMSVEEGDKGGSDSYASFQTATSVQQNIQEAWL